MTDSWSEEQWGLPEPFTVDEEFWRNRIPWLWYLGEASPHIGYPGAEHRDILGRDDYSARGEPEFRGYIDARTGQAQYFTWDNRHPEAPKRTRIVQRLYANGYPPEGEDTKSAVRGWTQTARRASLKWGPEHDRLWLEAWEREHESWHFGAPDVNVLARKMYDSLMQRDDVVKALQEEAAYQQLIQSSGIDSDGMYYLQRQYISSFAEVKRDAERDVISQPGMRVRGDWGEGTVIGPAYNDSPSDRLQVQYDDKDEGLQNEYPTRLQLVTPVVIPNIEELAVERTLQRIKERGAFEATSYRPDEELRPVIDALAKMPDVARFVGQPIQECLSNALQYAPASYKLWPWMIRELKRMAKGHRSFDWRYLLGWVKTNGPKLTELRQQNKLPKGFDINQYDFNQALEWAEEFFYEPVEDDSVAIYTFPDGWSVRELTTPNDMEYEGNMMNNCIKEWGSDESEYAQWWPKYENGYSRLLSLRDPKNRPHVSIEIAEDAATPTNWPVAMLYGNANNPPKPEYQERCQQFFDAMQEQGITISNGNHYHAWEDQREQDREPEHNEVMDSWEDHPEGDFELDDLEALRDYWWQLNHNPSQFTQDEGEMTNTDEDNEYGYIYRRGRELDTCSLSEAAVELIVSALESETRDDQHQVFSDIEALFTAISHDEAAHQVSGFAEGNEMHEIMQRAIEKAREMKAAGSTNFVWNWENWSEGDASFPQSQFEMTDNGFIIAENALKYFDQLLATGPRLHQALPTEDQSPGRTDFAALFRTQQRPAALEMARPLTFAQEEVVPEGVINIDPRGQTTMLMHPEQQGWTQERETQPAQPTQNAPVPFEQAAKWYNYTGHALTPEELEQAANAEQWATQRYIVLRTVGFDPSSARQSLYNELGRVFPQYPLLVLQKLSEEVYDAQNRNLT